MYDDFSTTTENQSDEASGLFALSLISILSGATTGAICSCFRLLLKVADDARTIAISRAHSSPLMGMLLVVGLTGAAAAVAAWLVRRYSPQASGSGIPHVEAVFRQSVPPAPIQLIPVKFIGGILAMGSGLALGREGPSVQMGASLAHWIGRRLGCSSADCLTLLAAGAGAGLATAFNAPIAGAAFALEELVRRFDTRITIATLGTSAGAIAISRFLVTETPDFQLPAISYSDFGTVPSFLLLGVLAGLTGVAYNKVILACLKGMTRLHLSQELRAGIIGATIGVLAWFWPDLVGGGDVLTRATLTSTISLGIVFPVFIVRFLLGPISYAAGTPGGLFAPLLVLGSQCGVLFQTYILPILLPSTSIADTSHATAFAVVGMAALFTAVVRSPLTGILLIVELTGSFTMLLPMLLACFAAMSIASALRDAPIYDSLSKVADIKSYKR